MANKSTLAKNSEYEQTFQTRHRPPGRPTRDADDEPLFPRVGVDDIIGRVAERRAYALVHEKHREELGAHYRAELKVLQRRGVEQVAADIGAKFDGEAS